MERKCRLGRLRRGFTLVELIVVLAILAVLVALFVPTYSGIARRATATVCLQQQAQMQAAFDAYIGDPLSSLAQKHAHWVERMGSGADAVGDHLMDDILIPYVRDPNQMFGPVTVSGTTMTLRTPAMIRHGSGTYLTISWEWARDHPRVLLFGVNGG